MSANDVPNWLKLAGAVVAILVPLAAAIIFITSVAADAVAQHERRPHTGAATKDDLRRIEHAIDRNRDKLDQLLERKP